jgi:hypothetical protein
MPTTVYRLRDGTRVPSVTTVLDAVLAKPALTRWANGLGLQGIRLEDYMSRTADIGTAAHELCIAHLAGREPKLDPALSPEQVASAQRLYRRFHDEFLSRHDLQPVLLEEHMVSEELCYGGTLDVLGFLDGDLAVVDFKTGKGIYDEHFHQTAAYVHLAHENGYQAVERSCIVRLGRDEEEGFEFVFCDPELLKLHWRVFQHAARIYELKHEIEYLSRGARRGRRKPAPAAAAPAPAAAPVPAAAPAPAQPDLGGFSGPTDPRWGDA